MSDVPDTEMLSAYLDGELTADEQVRVEQILATSPEARQLVEELRALGSTLQGLPQQKLDEDLSARVLGLAERRMLLPDRLPDDAPDKPSTDKPSAGRARQTLAPADSDAIGWLGVPWREISWRGMFSRRALIWTGVIVATAIAINFTSAPPPKLNHEIAKQGENAKRIEAAKQNEVTQLATEPTGPGPVAAPSVRSKGETADGSWRAPAGEGRKFEAVDGLARADAVRLKDSKAAEMERGELRLEKKKSLDTTPNDKLADAKKPDNTNPDEMKPGLSLEALVQNAPAEKPLAERAHAEKRPAPTAQPLSVAASPSAASGPAPPAATALKVAADSTKPAVAPPLPTVVMSKALAGNGALNSSGTNTYLGGTTRGGIVADSPMTAKLGAGRVVMKDADRADSRVAKSGDADKLMYGNFAAPNGQLSTGGQVAAPSVQGGMTTPYYFALQRPVSETYVLNVSKSAVQNKVFENLLKDQGLGGDRNLTVMAKNSPAYNFGRRARQVEEAPRGGSRDQAKMQTLTENRSAVSEPIYYEFDVTQAQLATILKQVAEKSEFFSTPMMEPAESASSRAGVIAQNGGYAVDNSAGASGSGGGSNGSGGRAGGYGGGKPANGQGQPEQAAGLGRRPDVSRHEAQQSQAVQQAPDSGAAPPAAPAAAPVAMQHVVFVLNVVDHVAPAAGGAAPSPAATAPATPAPK